MEKIEILKQMLSQYKKICIAYSGGVDSDFLLHMAINTLGKDHVLALIGRGVMMAEKDWQEAAKLAEQSGVLWEFVETFPLEIPEFTSNDKKRCYFCKKQLMGSIKKRAEDHSFFVVADGKNADDALHYRPGAQASEELGIQSPLSAAGFHKSEIRQCAKELGLSTWNKASNSCLATRFPYNTTLTRELLYRAEQAELFLFHYGIPGARVRVHQDIARIEIPKEFFPVLLEKTDFIPQLKALGYRYVTLDLEGFRSGSMD